MNGSNSGGPRGRPAHRPARSGSRRPTGKRRGPAGHGAARRPRAFGIREVELHAPAAPATRESEETRAFRVLIAVHRPRYRGRAIRASALVGWDVTALLNKQDVVGQVAGQAGPPDIVMLSGDFGRQRDYGIFRAIQPWRAQGMTVIGMVEDCETAPPEHPNSAPEKLCDICLTPPFTAAGLRDVLSRVYEQTRGEPAPPPRSSAKLDEEPDAEE
ncbi:MAG TPA: hypothetical protein VKT77_08095 [Chthonomonadaceae bacterium]|nr:hypothetical protein [Chthonomonadaceae bacterium]